MKILLNKKIIHEESMFLNFKIIIYSQFLVSLITYCILSTYFTSSVTNFISGFVLSFWVLATTYHCHHTHHLVTHLDSVSFVANVHLSKPIGEITGLSKEQIGKLNLENSFLECISLKLSTFINMEYFDVYVALIREASFPYSISETK